jgi:acetyltransferase-like isoleucine patch superfamily enzyme
MCRKEIIVYGWFRVVSMSDRILQKGHKQGIMSHTVNYVKRHRPLRLIVSIIYKISQCVLLTVENLIRNIPSLMGGSRIRVIYYRRFFKALGKDGIIDEGVIFYGMQGIESGSNVGFGRNSVIQGAGGLTFGNDVLMGPGCYIWTINHDYTAKNMAIELKSVSKPVTIGSNVWIAADVKIVPGIKIGSNSVIGMGSVVTKDVPPGCIVGGNPARLIRRLNDVNI